MKRAYLSLIILATCITLTACRTTGPDGTKVYDPVRTEKIKEAFKPAVATAVLVAIKENPKSAKYFLKAGAAICALNAAKEFTPAALLAILDSADIKELQTFEALAARNFIVSLYGALWADRVRLGIPDNTFGGALFDVLCAGITTGVQQAKDLGFWTL